jgi:hypothetical protein
LSNDCTELDLKFFLSNFINFIICKDLLIFVEGNLIAKNQQFLFVEDQQLSFFSNTDHSFITFFLKKNIFLPKMLISAAKPFISKGFLKFYSNLYLYLFTFLDFSTWTDFFKFFFFFLKKNLTLIKFNFTKVFFINYLCQLLDNY